MFENCTASFSFTHTTVSTRHRKWMTRTNGKRKSKLSQLWKCVHTRMREWKNESDTRTWMAVRASHTYMKKDAAQCTITVKMLTHLLMILWWFGFSGCCCCLHHLGFALGPFRFSICIRDVVSQHWCACSCEHLFACTYSWKLISCASTVQLPK